MAVRIPLITDFDGRGIKKAIAEFKQLEGAGAKAQFALQKALLPATAALAGLAVAGGKAVSAASDLSEETNKARVIFGDASKQIEKFASTAAKSLGQSRRQALAASSQFATLGKAAGLTGNDLADFAQDFTVLASDLASFNNTSPEEAIVAIGAALRGESEPIRRYGVLLNDATLRQKALELGLISTTKNALTPQQKALAASAVIMEQTKDAQGDFARTSDGLANSQRQLTASMEDLQASIGQALLPVVEAVLPLLKGMADWATNNSSVFLSVGAAIAFVATAIIGANVAIKTWQILAAATRAINLALATSFTTVQVSLGVIGAAVAVAGTAYALLNYGKSKVVETTSDLVSALKQEASAQRVAIQNAILTDKNARLAFEALDLMGLSIYQINEEIKKGKRPIDIHNGQLVELAQKSGATDEQILGLKITVNALYNDFRATTHAAKLLGGAFAGTSNAAAYANINFDKMRKTFGIIKDEGNSGGGINKVAEATERLRDAFKSARERAAEAVKTAIEMRDQFGRSIGDAIRNAVNFGSIQSAAKEAGKTFMAGLTASVAKAQEFGAKLRQLMQAGLSQQAITQIAQAGAEAGTEIANELLAGGVAAIEQTNSLVAAAEQAAIETGTLAGATYYNEGVVLAQQLTQGITDVIKKYKIKLSSAGLTEKQLKRLQNRFAVDVDFVMQNVPALADGGIVTSPTLALIGEAGPEAVVPLSRGGAMGNVTINVNGGDPNAVVDALRTYMRQNGSVPIKVSNLY